MRIPSSPSVDAQIAPSVVPAKAGPYASGELVATPVWIARDGGDLVVTTEKSTGKVKRLRRNPMVSMRPCTRMGRVADDAITVVGVARFDDGDASGNAALAAKYGLQFRIILAFERLIRRLQRKSGQRVILRIARAAE